MTWEVVFLKASPEVIFYSLSIKIQYSSYRKSAKGLATHVVEASYD